MKIILVSILTCFLFTAAFAQATKDSAAYEAQRNLINDMLKQRSQKFGQYDQSLSQHTGIFGFQTKKDIRRSNDILMDIVKTDNDIYAQLKILLDYRAFQQTQTQDHSKQTEQNNLVFMNTINKLEAVNNKLKQQLDDAEKSKKTAARNFILLGVLMAASILLLLRSKYAART
ncbi:MAG: hypothetical protein ACXVAY_22225 [Mucilaginibacter sp.]